MSRLLIFQPTIAPYRIDLFNDLYAAFDTKIVLEYRNLKDQKFDYTLIERQFNFVPEYLPQPLRPIGQISKVRSIIRRFCPDTVITGEYGLKTVAALLFRGVFRKRYRVIVISDDSYDMIANKADFTFKHRLGRLLLAPLVDDVIVVEPRVCSWYRAKYGKGIYFPIIVDENKAAERYCRAMPITKRYISDYGLQGKKVVLSVSRLVDLKNIDRVIEAFNKIETNATLVIVGDGPEREHLESLAATSSKEIIFTGRFDGDELYAWYNLAAVFILASYKEPFGAVTNEALLAGCRVIISRLAGSSCLVNTANGELCDPYDTVQIKNAMERQLLLATIPDLCKVRNSRMNISYTKAIKNLIEKISNV